MLFEHFLSDQLVASCCCCFFFVDDVAPRIFSPAATHGPKDHHCSDDSPIGGLLNAGYRLPSNFKQTSGFMTIIFMLNSSGHNSLRASSSCGHLHSTCSTVSCSFISQYVQTPQSVKPILFWYDFIQLS